MAPTVAWQEVRREAEFRRWAKASGQVACVAHEDWWLHPIDGVLGCSWCGATL